MGLQICHIIPTVAFPVSLLMKIDSLIDLYFYTMKLTALIELKHPTECLFLCS